MDASSTYIALLARNIPERVIRIAMIQTCDTGNAFPLGKITLWATRQENAYDLAQWVIRES